ncbi:MAG: HAD-IIB family hydrolase [Pseudomonadota bacterium]|nr:HAD-IIB family hydrolase [Pseudomonadota bacterium]
MKTPSILVFTDLDGTLLDHHNYSTAAAQPALDALKAADIPVIFNTSKTQPEVLRLRRALGNTSPYVCENGGAIYYPDDAGEWQCELPGASYDDILKVLLQLRRDGFRFRGFNDMTETEVAAVTGLSIDDAHFAKQRAATEPLLWQGSDDELTAFAAALEHHQLRLLKGGRFYHVMGDADKASAMTWLANNYRTKTEHPIVTIALGDGGNDKAMLEAADYPIVIPGEHATLSIDHPQGQTAKSKGPQGWNDTVLPLLTQLHKENLSG